MCARSWPFGTIASVYGPADRPDLPWFTSTLERFESLHSSVLVGDFNWRLAYQRFLPSAWTCSKHFPTTVGGAAGPTRLVSHKRASPEAPCEVTPLPGIPHHAATLWEVQWVFVCPQSPARILRCAQYTPLRDPTPQELERFEACCKVDVNFSDSTLEDSLANWHARAEEVFKQALSSGVVACNRSAERCKGAPVTTRPALPKPLVSRNEPVALRRLRRLHRAVVEEWRRGPGAPLTAVQKRHWSIAFRDKLFPVSASWPPDQAAAPALVSQAITVAERNLSDANHANWRQAFQRWDVRAIKAAKAVLKPNPSPGAQTAQDLCNSWKPLFCTPDPSTAGFDEAWVSFARRSGLAPREPAADNPGLQDFLDAVSNARGAPGLDGWTHFELKWLSRHVPGLLQELFCILRDATFGSQSLSGPTWLTLLFWRLAAVPKREADEYRPVAVGSTILRVWQKTLLRLLPDLPLRQLGGRAGVSVSNAIGDWLSHRGLFGAEIDLAKAFDNVLWAAASESLRYQGVSPGIIRFLSHVWGGPRFCSLHGTLSSSFLPVRGIPQGDPLSPCILAQVLRPWHALIQRELPDVSHWAFVDDRSLRAYNKVALDRALHLTKPFDVAVGLKQHPKKLQVWGLGDSVEHLGVVATITNLCRPVSLRGGWQRVFDLFSLLPRLPGGLTVREAAARCFIKPVWSWCLPYLQVPPQALAKHAMQALLCTACTWWCRGRFWVDRIDLHPVFGTAVAALQAAVSTPAAAWRAARPALEAYAAALRLEVVAWHGALPVLNAAPNTLEHRLLASCGEQVHGHLALNPASSKGQHGLRVPSPGIRRSFRLRRSS